MIRRSAGMCSGRMGEIVACGWREAGRGNAAGGISEGAPLVSLAFGGDGSGGDMVAAVADGGGGGGGAAGLC